jgi:cytochrome c peroxidase
MLLIIDINHSAKLLEQRTFATQMRKFVYSLSVFLLIISGVLWSAFVPDTKKPSIITQEKLGEKLFFDPILSLDHTISCASCHKPDFAFADTSAFSKGVGGKLGNRNTPSVMNMAMRETFFWDGRAASLEAQVVGPIENPVEMNLPFSKAVLRVRNHTGYRKLFYQVFKKLPDSASIVQAIASFERTLETDQTPNDRWIDDLPGGLTEAQIRGRDLFMSNRTRCFDCHFTPDFTADEFRNIGLFNGKESKDSGRYLISRNPDDIGKFKTPGLRNVAMTAPYMHDGSFKTLREVIDYYDEPAKFMKHSINRDTILPIKIGLSEQEKQDMVAFLHALTDDRFTMKKKK